MSKIAEESMNNITVYEMRSLYVSCGLIGVIGNGQLVKITTQEDSEAEQERVQHGY